MINYFIGVDGGGTGTRVRLADADGVELAQGSSGPSGLALGIAAAWMAVRDAARLAFADAGIPEPAASQIAIGLGLAGVHNPAWAAQFVAADPGYGALRLETDAFTTLMGAHQGRCGAIVALGTGSMGQSLLADGRQVEVGGWGFPTGDEASGAWLGLRAAGLMEQAMDGRRPASAFTDDLIAACGGNRAAIQAWLAAASQTTFATLAPIVLAHGASDYNARTLLQEAGRDAAAIARALDASGQLPLALCGGLGEPLRPYLPPDMQERCIAPLGDAASGALRMIELHVKG